MRFTPRKRPFTVGLGPIKFPITDCGSIALEPDEQVTFTTPDGGEYDVARKSWGFFATPSLNSRVGRKGFRPVLVKGPVPGGQHQERYFIWLVEKGRESEMEKYRGEHGYVVVLWLDEHLVGRTIEV